MQNFKISKATCKDKLSGKCFKNGAEILVRRVNEMFNFLITSGIFPNVFQKKLKELFMNKQVHSVKKTKFWIQN